MKKRSYPAYTLLEILVVLTIIGILLAIGMAVYTRLPESAMKKATQVEESQYLTVIYNYKSESGKMPEDVDVLLTEGYITKDLTTDAWGIKYQINYDEPSHVLKIISAGPDKKFGTSDDIVKEESFF
jgi:prepilin-type N-terminal cleavage/methylation domain-containing protein